MADHSAIEWCGATWNPIVGCSVLSPGCTNCYAMRMAARIEKMSAGAADRRPSAKADAPSGGQPRSGDTAVRTKPISHYAGTTKSSKAGPVWTGKLALAPERILTQPLRWKKPRTIFVNSMGDLFHEAVPDEWIDRVFAVMALCPQHTFQVLTKRSARMRKYVSDPRAARRVHEIACDLAVELRINVILIAPGIADALAPAGPRIYLDQWPLPNVWLGVSAERQAEAEDRIPDLLATPAAIRFVSAEPLLGPVNFRRIRIAPDHHTIIDALDGYAIADSISGTGQERTMLDWIIVGGESGPCARPMHPDWARSIRDQCARAGVPFFFKQWGNYLPAGQLMADGRPWSPASGNRLHAQKSLAGRILDGVEHNAMPVRP
jgi:protein gp37